MDAIPGELLPLSVLPQLIIVVCVNTLHNTTRHSTAPNRWDKSLAIATVLQKFGTKIIIVLKPHIIVHVPGAN